VPNWIELSWPEPQTVSAIRVVSGYCEHGDRVTAPLEAFVVEYLDGEQWRGIPQTAVSDNNCVDWHARFPSVRARRLRLRVTATQIDVSRIWEIEVYHVGAR
jgi:hypothetical protein